MDEAKWAIEMYSNAKTMPRSERDQYVSWSHQQAGWSPVSVADRQVHELLMMHPLPRLQSVYQEIFERILGQRVSQAGPRLAQASIRLDDAKRTGRPLLFVMHEPGGWHNPTRSASIRQLMGEYVVIVMPLREGPALSQLTGHPPFEASGSARPLFVVADSEGRQRYSVAGSNDRQLAAILAAGWIDALELNPPAVGTLVRAQRLLRKIHSSSADRARELTIRVQQEAKAEREKAKVESPALAFRSGHAHKLP